MAKMNEEMKDELRSEVYNALSDVAAEFELFKGESVEEKDMQEAIEWFMVHFYEDCK